MSWLKSAGAKKVGLLAAFSLFLVANPAFLVSCSSSEDEFEFGEEEMLESLEDLNGDTWTFEGYKLSLELEQGSGATANRGSDPRATFVESAHACSDRTFVKSAAACVTVTEMPVEGRLSLVRLSDRETVADGLPVSGAFIVPGNTMSSRLLFLSFEGGSLTMDSRGDPDAMTLTLFAMEGTGEDGGELLVQDEIQPDSVASDDRLGGAAGR